MADSRKIKKSNLWNCFDPGNDVRKMATCNICKTKLSYRTSTSNLKKHMERKHPTVQFVPAILESVQATSSKCEDPDKSSTNDEIIIEQIDMVDTVRDLSSSWDFFKKTESDSATCRLCDEVVRWNDDVTKLRRHLDEEHIGLDLAEEEIIEYTDTKNLEENLELQQTDSQRPKKRKKTKNNSNNSHVFWKDNSNSLEQRGTDDEQYEDSLERFGAYVTSLMKLLPRETAAKYQIQIIERLVKETSSLRDEN